MGIICRICDSYQIVDTCLTFMRNDVLLYYHTTMCLCECVNLEDVDQVPL